MSIKRDLDILENFRDSKESRFVDFLWDKFKENPEILDEFAESCGITYDDFEYNYLEELKEKEYNPEDELD